MAPIAPRHPPTKRNAAAELMRETDLTVEAIAAKLGVPYTTVCRWNQSYNWRPWLQRRPKAVDSTRWSKPRLAALERVYRQPGVDLGDLAQAVGTDRVRQRAFFRECGFAERVEPEPEALLEGTSLRRSLRGHGARQIAARDAALGLRRASPAESARMLRDLAALKKLVDEIEPPDEADPLDGQSLDELRASIYNRYIANARRRLGEGASDEALVHEADAIFAEQIAQCAPAAERLAAREAAKAKPS